MHTVHYYNTSVQNDVLSLPIGILARYTKLVERMIAFGPNLGMPHTRALGGGLFEIRAKSLEGIGRVFYCCLIRQRIVILHCFVKKTDKTPEKEMEIARRRLNNVKSAWE